MNIYTAVVICRQRVRRIAHRFLFRATFPSHVRKSSVSRIRFSGQKTCAGTQTTKTTQKGRLMNVCAHIEKASAFGNVLFCVEVCGSGSEFSAGFSQSFQYGGRYKTTLIFSPFSLASLRTILQSRGVNILRLSRARRAISHRGDGKRKIYISIGAGGSESKKREKMLPPSIILDLYRVFDDTVLALIYVAQSNPLCKMSSLTT